MLSRKSLIESITFLKKNIAFNKVPSDVINQTLTHNPWFTKYYISYSLSHIITWLEEEVLHKFLENYPENIYSQTKHIGVITAGNFPLAGFHDTLMVLLSGHKLLLKLSHQDAFLIPWILKQWIDIFPPLDQMISITDHLEGADYIIASGSTNTARFIRDKYSDIPQLIRKSRFSVAVLNENTTDDQLQLLTQDILLFNGLGCRNVSNIITLPKFNINRLIDALNRYDLAKLNPLYLEKVQFEKVRFTTIRSDFMDSNYSIIRTSLSPGFAPMGTLYWIQQPDSGHISRLLMENSAHIQCVINQGTDFGHTQCPNLNHFADNVDVMEILAYM